MHEHSLISNLVHQIESIVADHHAKRIVEVRVRLGALTNISAEHFREHFVNETVGTIAEGAALDVAQRDDPTDPHAQEIVLESVEVEEED